MKKTYYLIILFVQILIFHSCSGSHSTINNIITGNYAFNMTDSAGNPLVDGTMILDTAENGNFYGSYVITTKYVENFPWFATMQGKYTGTFDKTSRMFSMNMNPKLADANILIKGRYYDSFLDGEWIYSTMMGGKSTGHFKAVPVK
jgi:hypothetical protein